LFKVISQFFECNVNFFFKIDTSFGSNGAIDTITSFYPNGCIAEWIVYDSKYREIRHERYINNCDLTRYLRGEYFNPYLKPSTIGYIPSPPPPKTKPPVVQKVGYHKYYDDNKNIWMDGIFVNGKLKDGKLYLYDTDGLLDRIEIYKNFKMVGYGLLEP